MAEEGRLKQAIERFVLSTMSGVDYLAQYPGNIVSQSGQLFDFQPDSPSVPGLKNLAFYSGTPGITLTVNPAQQPRAVLFFQGGDPSQPALSFFSNPGLETYTLTAGQKVTVASPLVAIGNGASLAAARVTDPVAANGLMTAWMAQVVAQCAAATPPIVIPPGPAVLGSIQSGSSEVTIG